VRDLLLSVLAAAALTALGLAALSAVTLAPFVVTLQLADARRRSAAGWGAAALAGSGVSLAVAVGVLLAGGPSTVAGLAALAGSWAVPSAVWRSGAADPSRIGAHQ
jgi:hypothetical protein